MTKPRWCFFLRIFFFGAAVQAPECKGGVCNTGVSYLLPLPRPPPHCMRAQVLGTHRLTLQTLFDRHRSDKDDPSSGISIVDAVGLLVVSGPVSRLHMGVVGYTWHNALGRMCHLPSQ